MWVIKLSFCQNDCPMRESFWQKDSLITHTLFELWLIMMFSPVANFAQQPLSNRLISYLTQQSLWIIKLGPAKVQEWVMSVRKKNKCSFRNSLIQLCIWAAISLNPSGVRGDLALACKITSLPTAFPGLKSHSTRFALALYTGMKSFLHYFILLN